MQRRRIWFKSGATNWSFKEAKVASCFYNFFNWKRTKKKTKATRNLYYHRESFTICSSFIDKLWFIDQEILSLYNSNKCWHNIAFNRRPGMKYFIINKYWKISYLKHRKLLKETHRRENSTSLTNFSFNCRSEIKSIAIHYRSYQSPSTADHNWSQYPFIIDHIKQKAMIDKYPKISYSKHLILLKKKYRRENNLLWKKLIKKMIIPGTNYTSKLSRELRDHFTDKFLRRILIILLENVNSS